MLCAVCNKKTVQGKAYCAECQVRTDDCLFAASVKYRRFCGGCKKDAVFEQVNKAVVRCTSCGLAHEVQAGR